VIARGHGVVSLTRSRRARGFGAQLVTAGALAGLLCAEARAFYDPTDVLQLTMTAGILYDNNIFRIPDGNPLLFGVPPGNKADHIFSYGARVRYDKTVSRQRFIADVQATQNNYRTNTDLDYVNGNALAKWMWQIGNPWDGEASYEYRRYLSGFADVSANVKNLVTLETAWFKAGYRPHPRWRGWVGANYLQTRNSAPSQITYDTDITTGLLGLDYRTPSENTIGTQFRFAEGTYPQRQFVPGGFLDNQYEDHELSAVWKWNTTGQTVFDGRLGYLKRDHERVAARNFSGPTFRMNLGWQATGKTHVQSGVWRELLTYEAQTSNYVIATGVRITPTWSVTPQFSLQASWSYETRDYKGEPLGAFGILPTRKDDLHDLQLAALYSPRRNVELSLVVDKSSRDSNVPIYDYKDTTTMFNVKVSF